MTEQTSSAAESLADMRDRWQPSEEARAMAAAMLAAAPDADQVVVPLVHPGKVRHTWTADQHVITVPAFILSGGGMWASYSEARAMTAAPAQQVLDGLGGEGTVGWAVIERDGRAAAWEW